MKYKEIIICFLIAMALVGCGTKETVDTSGQDIETVIDETSNENTEEFDKNVEFLMTNLSLSQYRAEGAAYRFEQVDMGVIVECSVKDKGDKAYIVTLKNESGKEFQVSFSNDGYYGFIKDEDGNYLYAPID